MILGLQAPAQAVAGDISTFAGKSRSSGDGGPATSAQLDGPVGVAADAAGNFYIADQSNHKIRKVNSAGTITTYAGTGLAGYSGDGGSATSATLNSPNAVATDSAGNLYISDVLNHVVRKVNPSGVITTFAGTGTSGFSGDGGQATSAQLSFPAGVAADSSGNVFISDSGNERIRRVDASGVITTYAGSGLAGSSGDGGPATSARLNDPREIAVDAAGNLFIADNNNHKIRRVSTAGIITTFAGNGLAGSSGDGGAATSARLNNPQGVAADGSGNVYIADMDNQKIRRVDAGGIITTVAGIGIAGFSGDGGPATSAQLNDPPSVAVDSTGRLLIADNDNDRVRRVSAAGTITTVAGNGVTSSGDGGPATSADINMPISVARDSLGNFYVAEFGGHKIRKITPAGIISTVAGTGAQGSGGDGGLATSAQLNQPADVEVDAAGNLIIADYGNHKIRKVDTSGIITTVAGTGTAGFSGDGGPATSARLDLPVGVGFDPSGILYIADSNNDRVRRIVAGIINTVAGTGTPGSTGDGGPATSAQLNAPLDVDFDSAGNYLISDYNNHKIRKVDTSGIITTVAGTGTAGFSGDGGPATSARLWQPVGVTWDSIGNFFIADSVNNRIRKVNNSGGIVTVAGTGVAGYSGDGGPATAAKLNFPARVAFDPSGNFYLADTLNNRIRKVDALAGVGPPSFTSTSPASPSNNNGPRVLGSAEPGTTVKIYTDASCTSPIQATGTDAEFASPGLSVAVASDSTTTFYATATDGFGNVSGCSTSSITYVEDSSAPAAPSITSTPPDPTGDETPTWSFTGVGGATFSCELRDGLAVVIPFAACSSPHTYDLSLQPDSTYTFAVKQTDAAGNTGPESTDVFTLDSTAPPVPTITAVPPDPSNDDTPTWNFTGDGSSTLQCELTRGIDVISAYANCIGPKEYNLTTEVDGVYTFKVKQIDAANNTSGEATDSFTLDTAAPGEPTFAGTTPASPANDNSPSITGSAEAASTVRLYTDSSCLSAIAAMGPAATFASPGLGVSVLNDSSTTFFATATDAAGNTSPCSSTSITYVEDSTTPAAPTFTSTSPASPANDNDPFIKGAAEAGSTVSLYSDSSCLSGVAGSGSAASFATTGIGVSVADDSVTTFWARAADAAGNTSPCSSTSITYVEDSIAPASPTFSGTTPASPANDNNPLIQGSAEAGSTVRLYTDAACTSVVAGSGSAATFGSPGLAVSVADDSTTTFFATATDAANNVSACSSTSITYVESSAGAPAAPVITVTPADPGNDPTPEWEFTGEAGATFECELLRGVTSVYALVPCSSPTNFNLAVEPDGTYTFRVKAIKLGISGPFATDDYTLDRLAPAPPSITVTPADPTNDETPSWTFTGEGGGTFQCELRDGSGVLFAFANCSSVHSYNLSAEADDTYTFAVKQIDDAGNVGPEATDDFTLDTADPAAPFLTLIPADPGNDPTPTWEFTGELGASFSCELRDGAVVLVGFASCSSPHSFDLSARPDDTYTFAVTQTDAAGNTGPETVDDYTLDTAGPSVSITVVPPDPDNDPTPEWEFTGEAGAGFECQLSQGVTVLSPFASCTSPHTYDLSARPDGTYTFTVKASDPVGNEGSPAADDYVLDTTAPSAASIDSAPGPVGNDATPTWAFSGEVGATFQCQVTQGAAVIYATAPCTSPRSFDLSSEVDATYTFTVTITDAAGNPGPPAAADYTLDRLAPPAPTFTSTPSSPGIDPAPAWAFTSEPSATFECQFSQGGTIIATFAACGSPKNFDLTGMPDGTYTIAVRAVDAAGNRSADASSAYVFDGPPAAPVFIALPSDPADTTPTWGFTGEGGVTFQCRLSQGANVLSEFAPCSSPFSFDLANRPDGVYELSVKAVDALGRHGPATTAAFDFRRAVAPTERGSTSGPLAGLGETAKETEPPSEGGGTAPALPTKRPSRSGAQAAGGSSGDQAGSTARILTNVSRAVQFPLALLLIVVVFLIVQDRIDRRDPKLQFVPKLDPDLGFVPPPGKAR